MTDRQCLRCGDPLQSSSAISNYCMPCQMRLASSIDTERAARLAAEARVKMLEQAIDEFMLRLVQTCCGKGVQVSEFEQACCGQPDYIASSQAVDELQHTRAALKEPANG